MKNSAMSQPKGTKKGRLAKVLLGGGAALLAGHQLVSEARHNTSAADAVTAPIARRVNKVVDKFINGGNRTPLETIVQEGNVLIPPVVRDGKEVTPGLYKLTDGKLEVRIAGERSATKFTFDIERFPLGQKQDVIVNLEVIQTLSARQIAKLQDSFQRVFIDTPEGRREIDDLPTHPGSLPAYFIAAIVAARLLRRKRGAPSQQERNAEWEALSKIVGYCNAIAQMLGTLPDEKGLRDEYVNIRQIPSLANFLDRGVVPSAKEYPMYHGRLFDLWQRVTAAWQDKTMPQEAVSDASSPAADALAERVRQGKTFLEAIKAFFAQHQAEEFADQREFHAIRTGFRDLDQSGRTAWITGSPIKEPPAEEEQEVIAILRGYDQRINDLKPAAAQLPAAPVEEAEWDDTKESAQALTNFNLLDKTSFDALEVDQAEREKIENGIREIKSDPNFADVLVWITEGKIQATLDLDERKRYAGWLAQKAAFIRTLKPKTIT